MNLQQQVQQHLDSTGISLRELSRRSGVSHTTIGKILRGGTYKSDTANDLIFAMSFYGGDTARPVMQDKAAETLDATVEQLAAQRVNADLTHHADWDTDLQCAKYRRVMQLEKELEQTKAEVGVWRKKADKAGLRASELDLLVQRRDAELSQANDDTQYFQQQHSRAIMLLSDERKEVQRLTALSETHGQSWKAACVQVEQLEEQLADKRENYQELYDYSIQQSKDETEMLAQIDTLFAERDNMRTNYEQKLMSIRTYTWAMFAALVFVVASGLVVRGGV